MTGAVISMPRVNLQIHTWHEPDFHILHVVVRFVINSLDSHIRMRYLAHPKQLTYKWQHLRVANMTDMTAVQHALKTSISRGKYWDENTGTYGDRDNLVGGSEVQFFGFDGHSRLCRDRHVIHNDIDFVAHVLVEWQAWSMNVRAASISNERVWMSERGRQVWRHDKWEWPIVSARFDLR